jgi:undecaprenyl-diphosphatase
MRPWMGDNPAWIAVHGPRWADEVANAWTGIASPVPALCIVVALTTLLWRSRGARAAMLAPAAAAVVFPSAAIKALLGPSPLERSTAFSPTGTLPSTHTAFAASVLGLAVCLALRAGWKLAAAAIVVVIVGIGPLRVLEGAHWPSDVVAGYALGFGWLLAVLAVWLGSERLLGQAGDGRAAAAPAPGGD